MSDIERWATLTSHLFDLVAYLFSCDDGFIPEFRAVYQLVIRHPNLIYQSQKHLPAPAGEATEGLPSAELIQGMLKFFLDLGAQYQVDLRNQQEDC